MPRVKVAFAKSADLAEVGTARLILNSALQLDDLGVSCSNLLL